MTPLLPSWHWLPPVCWWTCPRWAKWPSEVCRVNSSTRQDSNKVVGKNFGTSQKLIQNGSQQVSGLIFVQWVCPHTVSLGDYVKSWSLERNLIFRWRGSRIPVGTSSGGQGPMYECNSNVTCLVFICVYIIIYIDRLVYTPSTDTSSHRDTCDQCIFLSFLLSSWNLHCDKSFGNSKVLRRVEIRNIQYCQIICDCLAINKNNA